MCLQNLLGLAQVVSWVRKPQLPVMCLVVLPSDWDLRTRGTLKGLWGQGCPFAWCPLSSCVLATGPAYLPTCHSLASWLTFYPQDSGHSKGGGHSCDLTPGCRVRALGRKKASKALSPWCPT